MPLQSLAVPGPTGLSRSRPRRRRRRCTWSSASLTRRTRNCTAIHQRQAAPTKSLPLSTMTSRTLLHPWTNEWVNPNDLMEIQKYHRLRNIKTFSDQKATTEWSQIRSGSTSTRARTCSETTRAFSRTWWRIRACRPTWTASRCSISNRTKTSVQQHFTAKKITASKRRIMKFWKTFQIIIACSSKICFLIKSTR